MRVLLVDGHADTAEIVALLFETAGHRAATARTADEALALCRGGGFDLLVAELALPGPRDGLALMREVRARHRDLPGIALTSLAYPSDVAAARAAGFDLHLAKPLGVESLLRAAESLRAASRELRAA